jgi:hypothetical protein
VGVYEGKRLKFTGRVGTGFSEKLLRSLYLEINKFGLTNILSLTSRQLEGTVGTEGSLLPK